MSSLRSESDGPATVFVVDDDEAMRESLTFLLRSVGLAVRSFSRAEEFLELYDPKLPGCLLTDVRMPGMGGLALGEELQRRGHKIPVIVMTAYADVPMAVRAMRGGAIDFVEKPFPDQELVERLQDAIRHDLDRRASNAAAKGEQAAHLAPPDRIGPYRILRKLGSGGMSEVFLAEDTELERRVALKFLPWGERREGTRTRFRREARAIASLNHPNIVTVFQILEEGGLLCIAMEYVQGRTLRELILREELDVDGALDVALQICAGLKEAHQIGIVHRDVKPENVIVDSRGRARLLDFGLALDEQASRITGGDRLMGTPAYMAPEHLSTGEVIPQSDIFALGIVLYEMLVGKHPYRYANPFRIVHAIMRQAPMPLPEDRDDLTDSIRYVVRRAMARNPGDRYPDVDSLVSDLLALREGLELPRPPRPVSSLLRSQPLRRRRRHFSLDILGGRVLSYLRSLGERLLRT